MKAKKYYLCLWWLFLASTVTAQSVEPSSAVKSFNGIVTATYFDAPNNVMYVGGDFNAYDPVVSNGLPVNSSTGLEDRNFPSVNGVIWAVTPDGNGGWFIGGNFNQVGGLTRNRLAQISSTGEVTAFNSTGTTNGRITSLKVSGNTLVVGGEFTVINGQSRSRLASFTISTGEINPWNPAPNDAVYALEISGGIVYVGGAFTSIGVGFPIRNRIAAVDLTTAVATSWDPNANAPVRAMVLSGSTLYVAGGFSSIGGQSRDYLAAIDSSTGLATPWNPSPDGLINAFASSGTTLFAGGLFSQMAGQARTNLCSFDLITGNLTTWNPSEILNKEVRSLAVLSNTLYVGRSVNNDDEFDVVVSYNTSTGNLNTWTVPIGGIGIGQKFVPALAVQGTSVYVGGSFRYIGGTRRNRLAAINAVTGDLLPWNPNVTGGSVNVIRKSGSIIYAGGEFTKVGSDNRLALAAISSTTGLATGWAPAIAPVSAEVKDILIDGTTAYVAGLFSSVGGQPRNNIAAVNTSTGTTTSWNPNANNIVNTLSMEDNILYCGGAFNNIGGQTRNNLAALSTSTGLATSWNPNVNGEIYSSLLNGDNLIVCGEFTQIGGSSHPRLRAISKTTGSVASWFPVISSGSIYTMAVQGGTLYLAGLFSVDGGGQTPFASVSLSSGSLVWGPATAVLAGSRIGHAIQITSDGVFGGGRFLAPNTGFPVIRENFARWDFCALPPQPGPISGNTTVCQGSSQTYSVGAVAGATSYTWTLPGGWTGSSATNSMTATVGASSGTISVTANNACGSGPAQILSVTVTNTPAQPGTISGNSTVCQGSSQTYSIGAVAGATSYTWTLPSGWTGSSTTTSITTTVGSTSGNVSVTANNACGSGTARTLSVTVNTVPAQPGTISGNTTVCSGTPQTYSIGAVAGATSYTWTLPAGWTGTSTTTSINTTAGSTGGDVTVAANNACGSSPVRSLGVTVNIIPAQPGTITGNATVCSGTSQTYSVGAVTGATSYTWTLPPGWTGTSTTNSITTTAGTNSGNVSVTANNVCGSSPVRSLAVTVNSTPVQPGTISGNTSVCQGTAQTYSITAVPGATFYTWSLPSGWTGSSTTNSITTTVGSGSGDISVTASNTCGTSSPRTLAVTSSTVPAQPSTITGSTTVCSGTAQSYSVTNVTGVTYTWDAPNGTITGSGNAVTITWNTAGVRTLTVTPSNSCGNGTPRTLSVTVNDGTPPAQPSPITGNTSVNINTTQAYSVTNVTGVTYTWSVSGGGTISGSGNSINVNWNTAGSFVLTCTPSTSCGSGPSRTLNVTVNKLNQTITFGPLAAKTFGDAPFTLGGTASSGLTVSYTSSNPSVATVSGNTVTIVGAGTSTITANQPGNDVYNAAAPVNQVLTVNKANQTITFNPLPEKSLGDPPFTLNATASSGLPVSYTSSNTSVATVSGNTVTILAVGSTTITALQAGNANYNAAPSVQQTLVVSSTTRIIALSGNLAFGEVIIGVPQQRTLTISNTGNSLLTISNISYPAGFNGNVTTGTIAAGNSINVSVTFNPLSAQEYSGQITVTSDATSGTNQVAVSGTGVLITAADRPFVSVKEIYPNPSNGLFTVVIEGLANDVLKSVMVVDQTGKSLDVPVQLVDSDRYSLDVREFPNGLYYVVLPGKEKNVKRIIKNN